MHTFLKNFLEPLSYLVYVVIFFLQYSRKKTVEQMVLFFYYIIAAVLLLFASYLEVYTVRDIDNNWLYNIFYLITICVLSFYFYKILFTRIKKIIIIILVIINLVVFITYDIIFQEFFNTYNQHVFAICFISIVVYALLYFDQLLKNVSELNILNQPDFWLVSGYLIYFLGCFFIIFLYTSVPVSQRAELWSLQNIILFCSSLITLAGYLGTKQQPQQQE